MRLLRRHATIGSALALLVTAAMATSAERSFAVTGFDSVRVSDIEQVDIVTGGTPGVVVRGAADEIDRLIVAVNSGILEIETRLRGGIGTGAARVRMTITVPMINHLGLRGAGAVTVNRLAGPGFTATLAGPGRIDVAAIDVQTANFSTTGSGSITAAGRCRDAHASSSGSGSIDIARLHCATLTADTAGSGDIAASAAQTAKVTITGAGDVTVGGGARCTVSAFGTGKALCR